LYWRDLRQPEIGFREWKDVLTVESIPKPLDAGDGTGGGWTTMVLTDSKQAVNGIDSQYIRIGVHQCHADNKFRINEIRLLARHIKTSSSAKGLSVDSSYNFDVMVNAWTWGGNQALELDGGLYPESAKIASETTFRTESGWLVSSKDSKLRCQSDFVTRPEVKTLDHCKIECNSIDNCFEFTWDGDAKHCLVSSSLSGCQASSTGVDGSKDRLYRRNAFIRVKTCTDAPLSSASNCWSAFDTRGTATSWTVSNAEKYPGRIKTRWMRAHFAGMGKPALVARLILRQHSSDDHISKLRLSCSQVDDIGRQVIGSVDVSPAIDTTDRQLIRLEEPLGPCTSVKVEVLEHGGAGSPGLSELVFMPLRVPEAITIEGWVKSASRGRLSSAGRTWQKFWWWKQNADWPATAKDVLAHAYGQAPPDEQCQSSSKFCFQRLPAHLEPDCTEILVEQENQGGTGMNRFKWKFSSTNEVSQAAWKAFKHGVPTVENEMRGSSDVWDPIPLQAASPFHAGQNSFVYQDMCVTAGCDPTSDPTVRSLILSGESQPDKMNCKSTLLLGISADTSQAELGVGALGRDASATSCRYPRASNGLSIYYRDVCILGGGVLANGGVKKVPQISRSNVKNFPSKALTIEAWAKCEAGNPESVEAMVRYKTTGEYDTSSPRLFGWWDASGTISATNGDSNDKSRSTVDLDFGNMKTWQDTSRNKRKIVPVLNLQILEGPYMHAHPGPSRRPILRMRRRSVITSKAEFIPRTYSAWMVARVYDQDPNADSCKIMSATSDEGIGVVNLEVRKDRTVHGMVFHNRVKTATATFEAKPLSTENYVLIGMLNAGDHPNGNGGTDDIIEIRVNGKRGQRNIFDIDNSGGFDAVARQLEFGSVDCSMDLAEVVVYDTLLGLKEIQTLERYLLRKWKIMGSEGGKSVIKAWNSAVNVRDIRVGFSRNFVVAPEVMGLRIAPHSLGTNDGDNFDFTVLATDATGFDLRVTRKDSRNGWQKKSSQAMKCNDDVPEQFVQVTMPGASVEDSKQRCTDLDTGCWEVTTKKEPGMDRVCRYAKSGEGCHPIGDSQWEHHRRGWAEGFEIQWWAQEKATINPSSALLSYSTLYNNEEAMMSCDGTLVIGGTGISTGVELYDNTWHHVAMTWESSTGHVHVYRDGKSVFSRGPGKVLRVVTEVSQGQGAERLAELYASGVYSPYAGTGTVSTLVHGVFEAPTNLLAESRSYYQRMDAYFVPRQSGDHTFTIAAAHHAELLISKDASAGSLLVVANTTSCGNDVISTPPRKWDACACQTSAPIKMIAGQRYYVRAVHTHLGGATSVTDQLAVGVASFPDGTSSKPIDATKYLEIPNEFNLAHGHVISSGGTVAVGQAQASPGLSAIAAQGGEFVVDEVRIWGSVRTGLEIDREARGLLHNDDPRRHASLWAYWRFDDDQRIVSKQLRQFVLKNKYSVSEGNSGLSLNPAVRRDACLTMVEDSNAFVIRVIECRSGGKQKERQVWQVRETGQITMVEDALDLCLTVVSASRLAVMECVPQQNNGEPGWNGVDRQRWSVVKAIGGGENQHVQICIEAADGESWCIDPQSYTEVNSNAGRLLKQVSVRDDGWLQVPHHAKRRSINTPTWVVDSSLSGRDLKYTPFTLTDEESLFERCRIRRNTRVAGFGSFGDEIRIAPHGDECAGGTKLADIVKLFMTDSSHCSAIHGSWDGSYCSISWCKGAGTYELSPVNSCNSKSWPNQDSSTKISQAYVWMQRKQCSDIGGSIQTSHSFGQPGTSDHDIMACRLDICFGGSSFSIRGGTGAPTPPLDLTELEQIVSSTASSAKPWLDGGCPGKSYRASFYTQTSDAYTVTSTCGTALENKDLRLACPYGAIITSVKFASFGTPTYVDAGKAACLDSGTESTFREDSSCRADATEFVRRHCLGKNSCEMNVVKKEINNGLSCSGSGGALRLYVQALCTTKHELSICDRSEIRSSELNLVSDNMVGFLDLSESSEDDRIKTCAKVCMNHDSACSQALYDRSTRRCYLSTKSYSHTTSHSQYASILCGEVVLKSEAGATLAPPAVSLAKGELGAGDSEEMPHLSYDGMTSLVSMQDSTGRSDFSLGLSSSGQLKVRAINEDTQSIANGRKDCKFDPKFIATLLDVSEGGTAEERAERCRYECTYSERVQGDFFPWKLDNDASSTKRCVKFLNQDIASGGVRDFGVKEDRLAGFGETIDTWDKCLSKCEDTPACRHVSYSAKTKGCFRSSRSHLDRDLVRLRVYGSMRPNDDNDENPYAWMQYSVLSGSTMSMPPNNTYTEIIHELLVSRVPRAGLTKYAILRNPSTPDYNYVAPADEDQQMWGSLQQKYAGAGSLGLTEVQAIFYAEDVSSMALKDKARRIKGDVGVVYLMQFIDAYGNAIASTRIGSWNKDVGNQIKRGAMKHESISFPAPKPGSRDLNDVWHSAKCGTVGGQCSPLTCLDLCSSSDLNHLSTGRSLPEGDWTHVAFTAGRNGAALYLNGDRVASTSYGGLVPAVPLWNVPVVVGRSWKGQIDDLRIWPRVKTMKQIRDGMFGVVGRDVHARPRLPGLSVSFSKSTEPSLNIRLATSSSSTAKDGITGLIKGRVEVRSCPSKTWHTLCDAGGWSAGSIADAHANAKVVCAQLGFTGGEYLGSTGRAVHGLPVQTSFAVAENVPAPILGTLAPFACEGTEPSIMYCGRAGIDRAETVSSESCFSHASDVVVQCLAPTTLLASYRRLNEGGLNTGAGFVRSSRGSSRLSEGAILKTNFKYTQPSFIPKRTFVPLETKGGSLAVSWGTPVDLGGAAEASSFPVRVTWKNNEGNTVSMSMTVEAGTAEDCTYMPTDPRCPALPSCKTCVKVTDFPSSDGILVRNSIRIQGLLAETEYSFKVSTVPFPSTGGVSPDTEYKMSTTSPSISTSPENLVSTPSHPFCSNAGIDMHLPSCLPSGGAISMDWGPPIDSGGQEISEYEIFMDVKNGEGQSQSGGYQLVGSINIPDGSSDAPTLRTIRLDSLSKGFTHTLRVRARNSITTPLGEKAWGPESSSIDILTSTGSKPGYIPRFAQVPAPNGTTGGRLGFEWDPPLDAGGREIISYSLFLLQTSSTPATECLANARSGPNPKCWRLEFRGPFSRDLVNQNGFLVNPVGEALNVNISSTAMPPPGVPTRQYSHYAGFRCNSEYNFLILATNAVGPGTLSPTSVDRISGAVTTQPLLAKTDACTPPAKMVDPVCKSRTSETLTVSWQPPSESDRTFDYGGAPLLRFEVQLSANRTLKDGIPRADAVILADFENYLATGYKYPESSESGKDFEKEFHRWKTGDDGILRPGSTYAVRVRMINTANKVGDWSNIITCETEAGELGTLKFAATDYSVYESQPYVDVTVTRVGGTEGQLGVSTHASVFAC
jgi:hypothetical protein